MGHFCIFATSKILRTRLPKPPNPNCLGVSCCVLCLFLLHPSCVTLRLSLFSLFRCFIMSLFARLVSFPKQIYRQGFFPKKKSKTCLSMRLFVVGDSFCPLSCLLVSLCLLCFLHPCFLGLVMVGIGFYFGSALCSSVCFNLFGPFSIYASIYFCLPASRSAQKIELRWGDCSSSCGAGQHSRS